MTLRLRAMRLLMRLPAVLFGLVVLSGAIGLVPGSWRVLTLLVAVASFTILSLSRVEPWLVRIWLGARRPHASGTDLTAVLCRCEDEAALEGYDVMLASRLPGGAAVAAMGRRSLIVDRRLIDGDDDRRMSPTATRTAVLCAIGAHQCRSHRADFVVAALAAPWHGFSCVFRSLTSSSFCGDLVRQAWRLRVAVAAVAVARGVQADDGLVAASVVVVLTALSYITPVARRAVESYEAEIADVFVRRRLTFPVPAAGRTDDGLADSTTARGRPTRLNVVR